jgi:hypothetical protein
MDLQMQDLSTAGSLAMMAVTSEWNSCLSSSVFHSMHPVVFQYNHYIYLSQHNELKIVLQHVSAIQPSSGILFMA